jgi:hypothetical protein
VSTILPLLLGGEATPSPVTPPSRAEILGLQGTFQGIWCDTSYNSPGSRWGGRTPLFDPAIGWFASKADRRSAYAAKRDAGDQLVVLAVTGQYHEGDPANFYEQVPGRDFFASGLNGLVDLIFEALDDGMRGVQLWLGGDGLGDGVHYNNTGGMTYGWQWLMTNFESIYRGLEPVAPWIVWHAGADGTIPGWAGPENDWHRVNEWIAHARSIIGPSGYLGTYESSGMWAWSGETNDYSHDEGLLVDQVVFEFPYPMGPPTSPIPSDFCHQSDEVRAPFDQVWQISRRALGPRWVRPIDEPGCDDSGTSPGIGPGTYGPRSLRAQEFDTYGHVRNLPGPGVTDQRRAYLLQCGWPLLG